MSSKGSYGPVGESNNEVNSSSQSDARSTSSHRSCWAACADDGWLLEIVCTVFGIAFIAALVIVLHAYDGKPNPQFGSALGTALTLNTVVSTLSTAAKAALLHPVAECISQLKWIWFSKKSRQLSDMTVFDEASRGIGGVFGLVWTTKLRTFAVLGSVLMIYGLAMDPFTQQLVTYHTVSIEETGSYGTIPITNTWNEVLLTAQGGMKIDGTDQGSAYSDISTGMKGAIQSGLYNGNETIEDISPLCPSSQCTFQTYRSLAVCSSFANVSSHLYKPKADDVGDDDEIVIALTNTSQLADGVFFDASSAATGYQSLSDNNNTQLLYFGNSIAFKEATLPLIDIFIVYAAWVDEYELPNGTKVAAHMGYGAVEYMMEWCVQDFTTEVVNGSATTTRHTAVRNFTNAGYPLSHVGSVEYSVDKTVHLSASRFLNRLLQGSVADDNSSGFVVASSDATQAIADPFDTWQAAVANETYSLSQGTRGTTQTGLEFIVNNIATSMTNYLRRYGNGVAQGTMYTQQVQVKVRWKWITAHVVLVVLAALLLISTMIATRLSAMRGNAWKSSTSAMLHALSPSLSQQSGGMMRESAAKVSEKKQLVRLYEVEDDGWRLVACDLK